jgi:predicted DNA-binding transcriptional regulator YafY
VISGSARRPKAFFVSRSGAPAPAQADLPAQIRAAIRNARKMRIEYADGDNRRTARTIRPFAMAYHVEATLACTWCELRDDFHHSRTDRIVAARLLDETFSGQEKLMTDWLAMRTTAPE